MSRSLKILGVETSTFRCQVALALDGKTLFSRSLPDGSKPTATLVPTICEVCQQAGWSPGELDLVCVNWGPGSYTGLRVGLTCAKTLAFAASAAMATADSLEVVACNAPEAELVVEVAFDAARGQVFACRFQKSAGSWTAVNEVRICDASEWAQALARDGLVLGPALVKYRELVPREVRVAAEDRWWPRAERVIQLGLRQFLDAPRREYFSLEPIYLRASAAEENRRP